MTLGAKRGTAGCGLLGKEGIGRSGFIRVAKSAYKAIGFGIGRIARERRRRQKGIISAARDRLRLPLHINVRGSRSEQPNQLGYLSRRSRVGRPSADSAHNLGQLSDERGFSRLGLPAKIALWLSLYPTRYSRSKSGNEHSHALVFERFKSLFRPPGAYETPRVP